MTPFKAPQNSVQIHNSQRSIRTEMGEKRMAKMDQNRQNKGVKNRLMMQFSHFSLFFYFFQYFLLSSMSSLEVPWNSLQTGTNQKSVASFIQKICPSQSIHGVSHPRTNPWNIIPQCQGEWCQWLPLRLGLINSRIWEQVAEKRHCSLSVTIKWRHELCNITYIFYNLKEYKKSFHDAQLRVLSVPSGTFSLFCILLKCKIYM